MRHCCLAPIVMAFFVSGLFAQNPQSPDNVLSLSLRRAIEVALIPEGNADIQLAAEDVRRARARADQAQMELRPDIEAQVSIRNLARNLSGIGLPEGTELKGFEVPDFSGAYNLFDARMTFNQTLWDRSLKQRVQTTRTGIEVAEADLETIRGLTAARVAKLYLWAARTDAMVSTARANVSLAETLLRHARGRQDIGTGLAIEVSRAEAQLANARHELLVAESERDRTHLNLLKVTNLDLSLSLELTDGLRSDPVSIPGIDEALETALMLRADYRAQLNREESTRSSRQAVELERLPSLETIADFGTMGSSLGSIRPTHTVGLSLRVPLFDGGRRGARVAEVAGELRQEEIRTRELRRQIELDISLAITALRSAQVQIAAAAEGVKAAESEWTHATRRYEEGIANSLEAMDSQNRLERARDAHTNALYAMNDAYIDLLIATGNLGVLLQ